MLDLLYRGLADLAPRPPVPVLRESRAYSATVDANPYASTSLARAPESALEMVEAFSQLVVVFRCAHLNALSVSSAKLRFYRDLGDGDRDEMTDRNHDLMKLFRRPNPYMSTRRWIYATQLYKELVGRTYNEIRIKPLRQMYPINAARVINKVDAVEGINGYKYDPGGMRKPIEYTLKDIWYDRFFAPGDETGGQSPLMAAGSHILANRRLEDATNAILETGMRPGFFMVANENIDMNDPGVEPLVEKVWQRWRGNKNIGRPLMIAGVKDVKPIEGLSPEKFQSAETRSYNSGMIVKAYGLWPIIFGEVDTSATRENAQTQKELYHGYTIEPRGLDLGEEISDGLLPKLGIKGIEDVFAELDFSGTPIGKQLARDQAAADVPLVQAGLRTANEVRAEAGWDPVAWGDAFWAPFGLTPIKDDPNAALAQTVRALRGELKQIARMLPQEIAA